MYVRQKVQKVDGTALTDVKVERVGPVNLFLQALFSTSEVTLQNKATFTCNNNPYRAYIQMILKYGMDAVTSQLDTQLFTQDDADSLGASDPKWF